MTVAAGQGVRKFSLGMLPDNNSEVGGTARAGKDAGAA
jgi:hypothetical protein